MLDNPLYAEISQRLLLALLFGGAIGIERSYHGRPAGFRTHALVCLSTCLLMLVSVYEALWFTPTATTAARVTLDPTRMAQGIMTGIGFIGAGAIIKEGLTVRGLTTAASIWITAAIGVLIGIGFYFPAVLAAAMTLGTLSVFRWVESKVPAQFYAQFVVRFAPDAILPETELREMVAKHSFSIANLSYRFDKKDGFFEYRMIVRSGRRENARALSETLSALESVQEFRLSPAGDS
ncbi:MAG TPA: MgtC/SapB family protein [Polyangiales bacterium]|nr:MgtC/SapB family protein [Polyangiales bacterium]